jgi:hypothetical protein
MHPRVNLPADWRKEERARKLRLQWIEDSVPMIFSSELLIMVDFLQVWRNYL